MNDDLNNSVSASYHDLRQVGTVHLPTLGGMYAAVAQKVDGSRCESFFANGKAECFRPVNMEIAFTGVRDMYLSRMIEGAESMFEFADALMRAVDEFVGEDASVAADMDVLIEEDLDSGEVPMPPYQSESDRPELPSVPEEPEPPEAR